MNQCINVIEIGIKDWKDPPDQGMIKNGSNAKGKKIRSTTKFLSSILLMQAPANAKVTDATKGPPKIPHNKKTSKLLMLMHHSNLLYSNGFC